MADVQPGYGAAASAGSSALKQFHAANTEFGRKHAGKLPYICALLVVLSACLAISLWVYVARYNKLKPATSTFVQGAGGRMVGPGWYGNGRTIAQSAGGEMMEGYFGPEKPSTYWQAALADNRTFPKYGPGHLQSIQNANAYSTTKAQAIEAVANLNMTNGGGTGGVGQDILSHLDSGIANSIGI